MASNTTENVLGRVSANFFILPPTDAKLIQSRFQLTTSIDNARSRPVNYARAVWEKCRRINAGRGIVDMVFFAELIGIPELNRFLRKAFHFGLNDTRYLYG